jgi:hypothetical protein
VGLLEPHDRPRRHHGREALIRRPEATP